jgi:hypothetical protein
MTDEQRPKRTWICRDVDPVSRDNEYYTNWQEYQLVDEAGRNRMLAHRRIISRWRDFDPNE